MGITNRIASPVVLGALVVLVVCTPASAYGQDGGAPLTLQPGHLLVMTRTGEFFIVDPATGRPTSLVNLDLGTREAYNFIVDAENQRIYVLTGPSCCQVSERGLSHVVEVDLRTGAAQVVFEKTNLVAMHLIPGDHRISLAFYPTDLDRITGTEPIHECILDISAGVCEDTFGLSGYEHVHWLEEGTFVGTIKPDSGDTRRSYLVDLNTLESRELPVVAVFASPIPGEAHTVLLTNGIGAGNFTRLDLETLETTVFTVQGDYDPTREFYPVSFSPDGRYLLFSYDHTYMVADSGTGAIAGRFENLLAPQWLQDGTGLIAMTGPDFLNRTALVLFSLDSPRPRTIATLENVCYFVVVSG